MAEQERAVPPPTRPLLVFDLNGVLCERQHACKVKADLSDLEKYVHGNNVVWERPGARKFLHAMHETADIAVWSSASQKNVKITLQMLFPPETNALFKFVWGGEQCRIVGDRFGSAKPQYTKDVTHLFCAFPQYERCIIIVDDDVGKATSANMDHYLIVPTWDRQESNRSAVADAETIRACFEAIRRKENRERKTV